MIEDQIAVCNSHQWPAVRPSGHVHYSWSALRSPGHGGPPASEHDIGDHLKKKQPIPGAYSDPVLVPQIHQGVASAPKVDWTSNGNGGHTVTWTPGDTDEDVLFWAFWERDGQTQKWSAVKLKHRLLRQQDVGSNVDKVAVKAIARKHGESGFGTKP